MTGPTETVLILAAIASIGVLIALSAAAPGTRYRPIVIVRAAAIAVAAACLMLVCLLRATGVQT